MPRVLVPVIALLLGTLILGTPFLRRVRADVERRNFRCATPGVLYRSGQMTDAGLAGVLDEYGIRTIVSFRDSKVKTDLAPDEFESELCRQRGIAHHRFTPLNWSRPDGSVPAQENVDRFVTLIHDPSTQWPLLVHCFAGVHRTGTFTAIYRMEKDGWTNADAVREMLAIAKDKPGFEADILSYLANYRPRTPARRMESLKSP